MKSLKYYILLLLPLLISCKGTQKVTELSGNEVTIISSSKEKWHSGAREGYSGTNYSINLIVNTDKTLRFDSLWAESKATRIKVLKNNEIIEQLAIKKGDTINLKATILRTITDTLSVSPPIKYELEQALIKMLINANPNYQIISDFEIIKGPLRP